MARNFSQSLKKKTRQIYAIILAFAIINYLIFKSFFYTKSTVGIPKKFFRDHIGNYEPRFEENEPGAGQDGAPHFVNPENNRLIEESLDTYGMNMLCSDQISPDRSVRDTRHKECKHWDYPDILPMTSIIIVFHNEGLSVLQRTINSVQNRSPSELLKEIVVIDDCSDNQNVSHQLQKYYAHDHTVRWMRNAERLGLIRTRVQAAELAFGEVIVFLDSHCEVNKNWLPPLLHPIAENHTTMTVPIIDVINPNTFQYTSVYERERGIFEWGMKFKQSKIPYREKVALDYETQPYKSPTHGRGIFAISKKYFLYLGGYDSGLMVWGGENMELSFKIWQCGGRILWVPCSRVGHVLKSTKSYGRLRASSGPLSMINNKRVIETWLDENHKENFYIREPLARILDMGDITEQLILKSKLKCKSFEWYLKNVAFEMKHEFPPLPPNLFWGIIKSATIDKCIDVSGIIEADLLSVSKCHGYWIDQLVRLNSEGQLSVDDRCIDADSRGYIRITECIRSKVDGPWQYDETTYSLYHKQRQQCITLIPLSERLELSNCNNEIYQRWHFKASYAL